jgi:hypothetical protein
MHEPAHAVGGREAAIPAHEEHPEVVVEQPPPRGPITGVSTDVTAFIGRCRTGPTDVPGVVRSAQEFAQIYGGPWPESPLGVAVLHFFRNGGRQAVICNIDTDGRPLSAIHVSDPTLQAGRRGLWMLDACDDVNLICIPPFRFGVDVDRATWDAAIAYAFQRGAMVLVDPPETWDIADARSPAALEALVSPHDACANAVLHFPRLRCPDPLTPGAVATFAPSGAVAGIYARIDAHRGVWKAPAGLEARFEGVDALSVRLDDAEQSLLNVAGINGLRTFPGGHVVWGARTLRGADALASEWKYVPVRRLALFIEASVTRGVQWATVEPSGPRLWQALRLDVETFLIELFRRGALQGRTPAEACFVRCDASTTTQDDVDQGVTNLVIGVAPLKPAEFVVLTVRVRHRR